jgi:hypothetical protein
MNRAQKTEENRMKKEELKRRLAPRMLWHSKSQGTYVRKQHGPLPGYK